MIAFAKVDSTSINNLGKRIIKFFEFGAKTASESLPFGLDTNPIKGMTAIHAKSTNDAESVIIGYVDTDKLAESGESRFFAKDSSGQVVSFVWLKANGNIELNGNDYSAVRFENLKTGLTNSDTALNIELGKIATAIGSLGGTYTVAPINTNIDTSKSETIKLK